MEKERKFTMTPKEQAEHKESELRRREVDSKRVLEETRRSLNVKPEDIDVAQEKAREREETKPWGI